jgi:methyl-accepting chemotaxis protein
MPNSKNNLFLKISHWSLKTKLTLIFLFVGILPALITTTISHYNLSRALSIIYRNRLKQLTKLNALKLRIILSKKRLILNYWL